MSAYPTVVQTGTKPTLNWSILYPSTVSDLVEINPPGTLTVTDNSAYASVQIVGTEIIPCNLCDTVVQATQPIESAQPGLADIYQQLLCATRAARHPPGAATSAGGLLPALKTGWAALTSLRARHTLQSTDGAGADPDGLARFAPEGFAAAPPATPVNTLPSPEYSSPPAEARVSLNGGLYQQLFFGTQADVNPAHLLYVKKLLKGHSLDFGGRYVIDDGWSPFFTTKSSNFYVVALVAGDLPPTSFSLYRQNFLQSYLKPYLDAEGRVNIGPLSVLIVMELDNSDYTNGCFDYQNMVLLVSFGSKHPNNGHGNNLDGVDVSNPGQGHGGPNGEIDPSGGVDDEKK